MTVVILLVSAAVLSAAFCSLVRRLPLLDAPDGGRKQQATPVPRTGGVGLLLALALVLGIYAIRTDLVLQGMPPAGQILAICALVLAPWLIGFLDDWLGLSALAKLSLLVGWAGAAAIPFILTGGLAGSLLGLGVFVWLLVISNASNFMDGSNGLAMGSLGLMCLGLFPLFALQLLCFGNCLPDMFGEIAMAAQLAIFGAVCGFLVWNMRGKLYAGDSGSIGLGGCFGLLAIYHLDATHDGLRAALIALTLSLPFLVDVLLTLVWRSLKGRNLLQAHTDHAYQRLKARGWGHVRTAATWWGFTGICVAASMAAFLAEADHAGASDEAPAMQLTVFIVLGMTGVALWIMERVRPLNRPG